MVVLVGKLHLAPASAKDCDLVSAIRLPGKTHAAAAGTDVVTDMLILRKRQPGQEAATETPTAAKPDKPGFTGVTTDMVIMAGMRAPPLPAPRIWSISGTARKPGSGPLVARDYGDGGKES